METYNLGYLGVRWRMILKQNLDVDGIELCQDVFSGRLF
jgi:hypothetical protein